MLLLAVMLTGAGTAWASDVTFTAGTDTSEETSITKDGITISFSSGVFNRTDNYRCYSGASMTISSTVGNITKIDFTATDSNPMTKFSGNPDTGSWANNNKTQWVGDAATINFGTTSGQCRMTKIVVTYTDSGSSTLTDCNLALTNAPIALSFDLYDNSSAQVIRYTTSSTGAVTIAESDYATFDIDEENKTITVTPTAVTPSAQTITVNQATDGTYKAGTATFTITITDSTPIPTYTVTLNDDNTTLTEATGGAGVTLPSRAADGDYAFAGWSVENISVETTTAPTIIPAGEYNPTQDITLYPVYTRTEQEGSGVEEWVEISAVPADGTYAICTGAYFMSATIDSKRFKNGSKSPWIVDGKLKESPATDCQWNIYKATDEYYRIKNEDKFAGATGSNNQGALLNSETDNYAEWTISYSNGFTIENVDMASANKNKTLRNNGDYGWATYAATTGNAPRLFMKQGGIITTTYYVSTPVADTRDEAGISFAEDAVTVEIVDNYTGQALTNPNNVSPITWTSSNETVATVENGTVTVLTVGETTIKASFAGDDNYKKAEVSYTLTVQDSRVAPGFSFSASTAEALLGETFDAPTFSNPNNVDVTFESTEPTVATIAQDGTVTILAAGTTTIKATSEANATYTAGEASYTLTVTDPNAPGTENNPYTVAEAKANTPSSGTSANVYIRGIVSAFYKDDIMSDGSNYRYYISDDGTTDNQLIVYKGKGLNNESFTSADDLQIGDEVVIFGGLTTYNNAPEVASGNYLVSWNRPVVTTPSISVTPATVNVNADEHDGTLDLAYANLTISDMTDFGIQYYDGEGEELSQAPEWIDVEVAEQDPQIGEGYVVSYVIGANDGEARTAYFKVYAMDDETNLVYSNLVTVSQAEYVPTTTYTLATTLVPGKHYVIASGTDGEVYAMGKMKSTNREAVVVTVENNVIALTGEEGAYEFLIQGPDKNDNYTIYDESTQSPGYLYAAGGTGSNHLKVQATKDSNAEWSISIDSFDGEATIKAKMNGDAKDRNLMRFNNGSSKLFSCYNSGQQPIYLFEKVGEATPTETIHVTDAKYATYCSNNALDFDGTGLTAYIAKMDETDGTTVEFTPVTKVPAYEGVLLKAENAGDVTVNATSNADDVTGNVFIGVTEQKKIDEDGIFVLLNGNKGVGFYKTTKAFTVGANTAYLPALAGGAEGARSFIGFDNMVTAIEGIAAEKMPSGEVYNLQGQRMVAPQKGLYIVNGKKVVIK